MNLASRLCSNLCVAVCLGCIGCTGRPAPGPEVPRPEQVIEFATLYGQNCAGCHGENGKNGAAISLANPVYLAIAGEATFRQITAKGIAGTLMPAFETSAGGTLTGQQIDSLIQGIFQHWRRPHILGPSPGPSYTANVNGDAAKGQKTFAEFCARCHAVSPGSISDASYLALVSDQSLRSAIIAGWPDQGMPDWRSDISGPGARAMTEQEIADVVAWLAARRAAL